ncbi:concanavalin A-like lectin/glucanase domain-containing protein [Triangularia setosa]|uniref:Concanavalin A-like lectin/glucanase domain-containing protein n=1 Tax=Triangularia setosa TaxID=2587417 RepID=A0AAN7A401_9PEZI|nr:concanavalin A-like lectin/glucanase domain-containing protein [Podospora setosa]
MNLRLLTSALTARAVLAVGSHPIGDIGAPDTAIEAFNGTSNTTSFASNGEVLYTANWAGLTLSKNPDAAISFVQGNFTLPTIAPTDKLQYMHLVIGLDGYGDCHGSFIQAGIAIKNNGSSPQPNRYYAFWEFNGVAQNIVPSFELGPGDEIGLRITVKSKILVSVEFYNARTKARYVTSSSSDQGTCLLSANWLVVRYEEIDVPPPGWAVVWTKTQWGTSDGKVWTAGRNQGPANEHLVQMLEPGTRSKPVVWCYVTEDREPVKGLLRCNRMAD